MDDAPAILGMLQEILEDDGYRVTTSLVRLELPQIRALHPDLILLELRFAGQHEPDGAFLTTLRSDPALDNLPIVLCTAWTRKLQARDVEEQVCQLGVHVVSKPFAVDALLALVARALAPAQDEVV